MSMTTDEDDFAELVYPQVMEVFGREGWDDPVMDLYNDLDPRTDTDCLKSTAESASRPAAIRSAGRPGRDTRCRAECPTHSRSLRPGPEG